MKRMHQTTLCNNANKMTITPSYSHMRNEMHFQVQLNTRSTKVVSKKYKKEKHKARITSQDY